MGPPSSGGSTVGEALNILEGYNLSADDARRRRSTATSRRRARVRRPQRYLGDPDYFDVPLSGLLSKDFAGDAARADRRPRRERARSRPATRIRSYTAPQAGGATRQASVTGDAAGTTTHIS